MRSSLTFLFLIGFVTFAFGQVKRYVKPTATGNGSGLTWANASNNLQAMIDASASGGEVWVASGTYKPTKNPTGCSNCTSNRDSAFSLKAGVKVYGGFTGTETVLGQRYWAANITILSGDIGVPGDNTDNAYHVVVAAFGSSTPTTQIDGFTITGGRADGSGSITINGQSIFNNHGGGIYVYGGTNNTISNNTIFGNSSTGRGGGIYATLGSINIITNIISGNSASSGGGILTYNNTNSTFTNNSISGNSATFGGGVYTLGGTNIITNSTISGNSANTTGGIFISGGTTSITNSIVWGNNSGLGGSTPSVTYSIVQSGFTGCMSCPNTNGNVDPQFISALAPGLNTGGNYNLKPISPAINVGNNAAPGLSGITTDIMGAPRIFNDTVDLGAYELYNGTQNVGIGTHYPGAKLEVAGGVKIADSIYIGGQVRILSGSPGPDKVLTSDASGLASWKNINEQVPGTVAGQMQYWDGTTWINVNPPSGNNKVMGFENGMPTWLNIAGLTILGPTDVYNPNTGKVWMDRNLGATQVATSSTDAASYGDLFQWGRGADGHQVRSPLSGTISTLSSTDIPGHGNFIVTTSFPSDWRSPQNNTLWQGVSGTNNPCPTGYRLPTETEWNAERSSWSSNNSAGAFASRLKLPLAINRLHSDGSINRATGGYYWSSTVDGTNARYIVFGSSSAVLSTGLRALGLSVRCIKD